MNLLHGAMYFPSTRTILVPIYWMISDWHRPIVEPVPTVFWVIALLRYCATAVVLSGDMEVWDVTCIFHGAGGFKYDIWDEELREDSNYITLPMICIRM